MPEQTVVQPLTPPTLPSLSSLAQKFWEELLGLGSQVNNTGGGGVDPTLSDIGGGRRW